MKTIEFRVITPLDATTPLMHLPLQRTTIAVGQFESVEKALRRELLLPDNYRLLIEAVWDY